MANRKVTYLPELVDNNIELSVRHLKQFFKFGHGKNAFITKAVHNISFDIKKANALVSLVNQAVVKPQLVEP